MCLDDLSWRAHALAETLIERGWDRTAAWGYASGWMRKMYWSAWSSSTLTPPPEDTQTLARRADQRRLGR